jgi:hypothetical protein
MTAGATLLAVLLATGEGGGADLVQPGARDRSSFGVEMDFLPVVLSGAAGDLGVGINAWFGIDRFRLRLVGTHVAFPSSFAPDGFTDRKLDVVAGIVDFFPRSGFSGPWLGSGVEYWWNSARAATGGGIARWESPVYTLGSGWVIPLWRGLYVNPWVAGHVLLSKPSASADGQVWTPGRLTGEVSVKLGWLWSLG